MTLFIVVSATRWALQWGFGDLLPVPELRQMRACMQPFDPHERRPVDLGCGHAFCDACLLAQPNAFRLGAMAAPVCKLHSRFIDVWCRRCPDCRAAALNPHVAFSLLRLLPAAGSSGAC